MPLQHSDNLNESFLEKLQYDPTWLIAAIFFLPLLILFLLAHGHYQSIWYTSIAASLGIFFYFPITNLTLFTALFMFRYVRFVGNIIAFRWYTPILIPPNPILTAKDVTVIVPTVEPDGKEFKECIESILNNRPAKIIVVTAGKDAYANAVRSTRMYRNIVLINCDVPNKRNQICKALPKVDTLITILCDDHVFWPNHFLPSVLAPFEDSEDVGCVGTRKRVRRDPSPSGFWSNYWNVLGCLYLERHNFEIVATNTIDNGVFVVSGRTSAHRSAILKDPDFMHGFENEYIFFGLVGPLNADDDNFITRWMVNNQWKIKIQYSDEACIETTLGEYPKFLHQCIRWTRTTWRSNPRSLISPRVWQIQWWCIYAVHISSLFNFAIFYDGTLLYLLTTADDLSISLQTGQIALLLWILCSKVVKTAPHFRRYPRDLVCLPGYILFAYLHSGIKAWALLTFWVTTWGSRQQIE